jgi:hypothetical protein
VFEVLYVPPLDRVGFESIKMVAQRAYPNAEIAEVVFRSGKRLVIIWQGDPNFTYIHIEPGQYLGYDTERGILSVRDT